jgi:hypothetical protein
LHSCDPKGLSEDALAFLGMPNVYWRLMRTAPACSKKPILNDGLFSGEPAFQPGADAANNLGGGANASQLLPKCSRTQARTLCRMEISE